MKLEPFYERLGRRIALRRAELGMTQAQLASMVRPRVTRQNITNIEAGWQRVLAHQLVMFSRALQCDVSELARLDSGEEKMEESMLTIGKTAYYCMHCGYDMKKSDAEWRECTACDGDHCEPKKREKREAKARKGKRR